jgi:hypothetical protein
VFLNSNRSDSPPVDVQTIERWFVDQDREFLRRSAHNLKSVTRMLG